MLVPFLHSLCSVRIALRLAAWPGVRLALRLGRVLHSYPGVKGLHFALPNLGKKGWSFQASSTTLQHLLHCAHRPTAFLSSLVSPVFGAAYAGP